MELDDRCGKLRSVEISECDWTIVAGKLRSVESLNVAGRLLQVS